MLTGSAQEHDLNKVTTTQVMTSMQTSISGQHTRALRSPSPHGAARSQWLSAPPGLPQSDTRLLDHTLVSLLVERALQSVAVAASHRQGDVWVDVTWQTLRDQVRQVSNGLVALGVRPGDRVAIFSATSLRWLVCDLAVSAARAVSVSIYPSSTAAEVRHILDDSEAMAVLVDHDQPESAQAGRLSRCREALVNSTSARHVIALEHGQLAHELGWDALLELGATQLPESAASFEERVAAVRPSDTCSLIYTSGTTGRPKGVVLTHGNWTFEAGAIAQLGHMQPTDTVLLFLPLAHAFAQATKATWLGLGYKLIIGRSPDKLAQDILETQPSVLPAVPRVFEKLYQGIVAMGSASETPGHLLFRWAMRMFDASLASDGQSSRLQKLRLRIALWLVFARTRKLLVKKLGGNMRIFISGGAPLSKKVASFFDMLDLTVLEGYGLTETCAAVTLNRPEAPRIGTVGQPLPGVELRLAEDGEILVRGGNITRGYYRNPHASALALTADGWFRTGDMGMIDVDGYVRITDRKKDIIVTSVGKKIPPQPIESELCTAPIVSNALLYGERRKYITALITIDEDVARRLITGSPPRNCAALTACTEVQAAVQAAVDEVNATLPPYARIQRFAVVPGQFTQEAGEVTPTLKLKRQICAEKYQAELEKLYEEPVAL